MALTQISTNGITDGTIVNADVSGSAAIAGTKIAPDFGSQNVDTTGNILLDSDSNKLKIGDGEDLQLYHDGGSHDMIESNSTYLVQEANNIIFRNLAGNEDYAKFLGNGACELYYDNSKKLETNSSGVSIWGNLMLEGDDNVLYIGHGSDLRLYHSSGNSYIRSYTGELRIQPDNGQTCKITNQADTVDSAKFIIGGAVELYHNDSKKLATASTGIDVSGGKIEIIGNEGGEAQLQLKADEGDDNDDTWRIIANTDNNLILGSLASGTWEKSIKAIGNGATQLFYDDSEKIKTTSSGIEVTGQASASGNSAMWQAAESGGATVRIQAGGAVGYCNVVSNHPLVIRTNDADSAKFYDGDFFNSKTGYTGSFSSSTGNSVFGWGFYHNGTANHQISTNSYGAEIINCNNTHSSGGTCSLLQYRTLNSTEGSIQGDSSGLAISNVSDYRKKERITDLTGSLAVLDTLKPRQYYYREGFGKPTRAFAGFIAHELQTTSLPQLTTGTKDAVVTQADKDNGLYNGLSVGDPVYQTVKYSSDELITHLVNGIKELKAEVETLKTKVAALETG